MYIVALEGEFYMRGMIAAAACFILVACSSEVRDTRIADIDFNDAASVQAVSQKLTPKERETFNNYIMSRVLAGNMDIKEVVTANGSAPVTVREALALTERWTHDRSQKNQMMKERNTLVETHNRLIDGRAPSSDIDAAATAIEEQEKKMRAAGIKI